MSSTGSDGWKFNVMLLKYSNLYQIYYGFICLVDKILPGPIKILG